MAFNDPPMPSSLSVSVGLWERRWVLTLSTREPHTGKSLNKKGLGNSIGNRCRLLGQV
jgi:hypothetical protein